MERLLLAMELTIFNHSINITNHGEFLKRKLYSIIKSIERTCKYFLARDQVNSIYRTGKNESYVPSFEPQFEDQQHHDEAVELCMGVPEDFRKGKLIN